MPGLQHFVVGLAGRNDHIVSEWELNIPVDSLFEFRNSFSQWFIIRVLLKEWARPLRRHAKSRSWSAWANRLSDWNIHLRAVNDFLQSTSNNNFYSRVHFRSSIMLRWIWHHRSGTSEAGGDCLKPSLSVWVLVLLLYVTPCKWALVEFDYIPLNLKLVLSFEASAGNQFVQ